MAGEAKRAKIDPAPYLAIDACSKQIVDLKQSFNQRMTNFENRMAAVTACCNSVVMRLDSLESLIKSTVAPGGTCNTTHRHPCCDEVLRLLKGLKQEMSSLGCGETSSMDNQYVILNLGFFILVIQLKTYLFFQVKCTSACSYCS